MEEKIVLKKIAKIKNEIKGLTLKTSKIGNRVLFLCHDEHLDDSDFKKLVEMIKPLHGYFAGVCLLENGIKPEVYEVKDIYE